MSPLLTTPLPYLIGSAEKACIHHTGQAFGASCSFSNQ